MKILGIQVHHNSSACLFKDGSLIYYNQEERLSRKKNKYGIPLECLKDIKDITHEIDAVVISGYDYNDSEQTLIHTFLLDLGFEINERYTYFKSHHFVHAVKAFFSSNFSDAIVIVWDGRGSTFNLSDGSLSYETTTAFRISFQEVPKVLYKKLHLPHCKNKEEKNKKINELQLVPSSDWLYNNITPLYEFDDKFECEISTTHDIGHYYGIATQHFGWKFDDCGKLMGLHSYGNKDEELNRLIANEEHFKPDLLDSEDDYKFDTKKYSFMKMDKENEKKLINFSYETQKSLEKIGLNFIQKILKRYPCKNLILTGGVSLNIVANSFYRKNLPEEINLYVDPLCGDEGNSIGAAQLFFYDRFRSKTNETDTLYLSGNLPSYKFELNGDEQIFENIDYSFVVKLLLEKNIVSIFQGRAEAGPRALGNRSLLFDPRIKNGKEVVNQIKQREAFRPFACSILLEESSKWFDMSKIKESPHMMYSFDALPGVSDIIPSVVHVDNTCRIQTVTEKQNYHYYNLIKTFYKETGVPILFNTSFNLAGDPIVEKIDDALETLRKSKLEYLYLPEISKLIYIKNK